MWYVGIIILVILFVAYMRSNTKNNTKDFRPKENYDVKPNPTHVEEPPMNHAHRRDYRIHRPVSYRTDNRMRASRSSTRTITHQNNGTPRGGGTGGSRGSSSSNGPSGGRR